MSIEKQTQAYNSERASEHTDRPNSSVPFITKLANWTCLNPEANTLT